MSFKHSWNSGNPSKGHFHCSGTQSRVTRFVTSRYNYDSKPLSSAFVRDDIPIKQCLWTIYQYPCKHLFYVVSHLHRANWVGYHSEQDLDPRLFRVCFIPITLTSDWRIIFLTMSVKIDSFCEICSINPLLVVFHY